MDTSAASRELLRETTKIGKTVTRDKTILRGKRTVDKSTKDKTMDRTTRIRQLEVTRSEMSRERQ